MALIDIVNYTRNRIAIGNISVPTSGSPVTVDTSDLQAKRDLQKYRNSLLVLGKADGNAVASSSKVKPPTGFKLSTLAMPNVYRIGFGNYVADVNVDALRPATGVTYYVSPTGSAGAAGGLGTPTTLPTAIAKSDVGTIICAPGEYFRNNHTSGTITKSINIIAQQPGVVLTGFEDPSLLTWTLQSGNVYQCTRANTNAVVDKRAAYLTAAGDFPLYTKVPDLVSVNGPGKWAIVGSTVYVWALGNANLVTDATFMRLSLEVVNMRVSGANTLYLRGLQVEGGPAVCAIGSYSNGGPVPTLIAEDCVAKYNAGNGFGASGGHAILIRCGAAQVGLDGLNYHSGPTASGTSVPDAIEVDCWARDCGIGASIENNNGSTSHDGVRILRVGGNFVRTFGPVVHDTLGAKSWNLGVTSGGSTATITYAAYMASVNAELWLEECNVSTSVYGIQSDATGSVHTRRIRTGGNLGARRTVGTGIVDTY